MGCDGGGDGMRPCRVSPWRFCLLALVVTVSLRLTTQATGHLPKVWVDDVELMEAP